MQPKTTPLHSVRPRQAKSLEIHALQLYISFSKLANMSAILMLLHYPLMLQLIDKWPIILFRIL